MLPEIRHTLEDYGVDVEETLARFVDNEDMMIECMRKLLQEDSFSTMVAARAQGNMEGFQFAVHSLKGLSANLGLTPLYEKSSALMVALRAAEESTVDKLYTALCEEYERAAAMLERL